MGSSNKNQLSRKFKQFISGEWGKHASCKEDKSLSNRAIRRNAKQQIKKGLENV